jgi:formylglycine-generating enzyme required for sulfatase activity
MEFVLIPAGSFEMGCSEGDGDCEEDEKPRHSVTISQSFYMGKYEVTQGQWKAVMGTNPSYFKNCGDNCPVEQVSWEDAQEYIKKLCEKENMEPCKYRLPTEAEWEYSARAGSKTKYYWGESISDAYLWYDGNSGGTTHPVGQKKPNAWGLYDMSGNVWEWNEDWYDSGYYGKSPSSDPKGAESGSNRVQRGGSWDSNVRYCRSSLRDYSTPAVRYDYLGFRLAWTP